MFEKLCFFFKLTDDRRAFQKKGSAQKFFQKN
jgi:hypothetical protein